MADKLLQSTNSITVPGWYRDPTGDADQRFWDGAHWTLLTRDDVLVDGEPDEILLFEPPVGHPDASPVGSRRRRTDSQTNETTQTDESADRSGSLFPVSSGPERRVVKLEPAMAELPKRKRTDGAAARPLFGERSDSDAQPPRSPAFAPTVVKPTRIASSNSSTSTAGSKSARNAPAAKRTRPREARRSQTATVARSRRRLLALALLLGAGGLTIGYVSGSSDSEVASIEANKSLTESVNSSVAASGRPGQVIVLERELQRAGQDLKNTNDELGETTDELLDLENSLNETEEELEVVTAERDDLREHNDILQTWFTDDLRTRGQIAWDNEVTRACGLVNQGAILSTDLLQYSRAMELIGTEGALYRAVAVCAAG